MTRRTLKIQGVEFPGDAVFPNALTPDQIRVIRELMSHHPAHCPVCPANGNCWLQRAARIASVSFSEEVLLPQTPKKVFSLSDTLELRPSYCIGCGECIRLLDRLGCQGLVLDDSVTPPRITPASDPFPELAYAHALADRCPTGALSQVRKDSNWPWENRRTPFICPECAAGCEVILEEYAGRLCGIFSRSCTDFLPCDSGRRAVLNYDKCRVRTARVRDLVEGERRVPTATAIDVLAGAFEQLPCNLRVVWLLDAWNTLEEAAAVFALALCRRNEPVALALHGPGPSDSIQRRSERGPNRRGIDRLASSVGIPLTATRALFSQRGFSKVGGLLAAGIRFPLPPLPEGASIQFAAAVASHTEGLGDKATHLLPGRLPTEKAGRWILSDGRVHILKPAVVAPEGCFDAAHWLHGLGTRLYPEHYESQLKTCLNQAGEIFHG